MRTLILLLLAAGPESERPLAWPSGPMEVRVALARPFDPATLESLAGRTIPFGEPGVEPRPTLKIAAARLDDASRTLILLTDPHPRRASYSLELPGLRAAGAYNLSGVEATWDDGSEGAKPAWVAWWPRLDVEAAREQTEGSAGHRREFALLAKPGRLTLSTLLTLPRGKAALALEANAPIVEATLAGEAAEVEGKRSITLDVESTGDPVDLSVTLRTGPTPPKLRASIRNGSGAARLLSSQDVTVPWAPTTPPAPPAIAPLPFDLTGGDRTKGEAVFFSEEAKCSACHRVRGGKGGEVGPDLGELVGRDPATVYRDIAEPSAVIRPEYVPYTVALKDGRVAVGLVRAEGADGVRVLDAEAKAADFRRSDIEQLRPAATSIMPVGLAGALGEARMRDLLVFLLSPPPAGGAAKP